MITNNISLNKTQINPNSNSDKTHKALTFGGFTRIVCTTKKHPVPFFNPDEFTKISSSFQSKIVGNLPKDFLELFPQEPKKVFEFFNQFANLTKNIKTKALPKKFQLKLSSGKTVSIKPLNEGKYGRCFEMRLDKNKSYCFKTFMDKPSELHPEDAFFHGATAEIRTGLNLGKIDYQDTAKWYIGNFDDKTPWQIMEFLDNSTKISSRKGKKLKSQRPELLLGDSATTIDKNKNNINGVRYDLGGISSIKKRYTPPAIDLDSLPTEQRAKKYQEILNSPDPSIRKFANTEFKWLPVNSTKEAFYARLNHSDPNVKKGLATQIFKLQKKDRKDAFYKLLNHPQKEVQTGIESQIRFLKDKDKQEAYNAFFRSTNLDSTSELFNEWLLKPEQKELFDNLLEKFCPLFKIETRTQPKKFILLEYMENLRNIFLSKKAA